MDSNSVTSDFHLGGRQARIHRRLALIGPGPAAFYHDACRFLSRDGDFLSASHLVAHLLREVESSLRAVLMPRAEREAPSATVSPTAAEHRAKAQVFLHEVGIPEADPTAEALLRRLNGASGHKAQVHAILADLGFPKDDQVVGAWLEMATRRPLHARAHRAALGAPRPFDDEFRRYVDDVESVLDRVLERFELRYADFFAVLDEIAAHPQPEAGDVEALKQNVPNNLVALEHFFGRLASPEWLDPLRAKGFFGSPPAAERSTDGDRVLTRYFAWPPSRFLVRMARAGNNPSAVLRAAVAVPATDNPFVQEDLVATALALPPDLAAKLVPTVKQFPSLSPRDSLTDGMGRLVSRLARDGQPGAALDLAAALLALEPGPRVPMPGWDGGEDVVLPPDPQARFDRWSYEQVLERDVPDLVAAAGLDALRLLCDVLHSAVVIGLDPDRAEPPHDMSHIWRRAIEADPDAGMGDERDALVEAIRDAAEYIVEPDPAARLPQLLDLLAGHGWDVFWRLDLHLVRRFGDAVPDHVRTRLTDRDLFDRPELGHEYDLLARERFGRLAPTDQETVLGWIAAGPDFDVYREWRQRRSGEPVTEAKMAAYAGRWQRDRLAPIRDALPRDWRACYDALVAAHGAPRDEGRPSPTAGTFGPASPKSVQELEAMGVEELAAYLESWEPPGGPFAPSPEGLTRALAWVVRADPGRYAAEAARFSGLEPTSVRGFVEGFREALARGVPFPWEPVMEFCRAVVERPRGTDDRDEGYLERDASLGPARLQIARLLTDGLAAPGQTRIPLALRDTVWAVLRPLTEDPEPTPTHEERFTGPDATPVELITTAVRRAAIAAVVDYAMWIWSAHIAGDSGAGGPWRGLDSLPGVRDVLTAHLDPAVDRAPTVRAVYGVLLSRLAILDPAWVKTNLSRLFPEDPGLSDLRDAAWEAYVVWNEPTSATSDQLGQEYRRAIQRLTEERAQRRWRGAASPANRLAEHLMDLYRGGAIPLDDTEALLGIFFAQAPVAVRAHAVEVAGHRMRRDGTASDEVRERLAQFWEHRLVAAEAVPDEERAPFVPEVANFGSWFATGVFENEWALRQLRRGLELARAAKPRFLVVERLVVLSHTLPRESVEALELLTDVDPEDPSAIGSWDGEETILTHAQASNDATAREAADRVARKLVAQGQIAFRRFLDG